MRQAAWEVNTVMRFGRTSLTAIGILGLLCLPVQGQPAPRPSPTPDRLPIRQENALVLEDMEDGPGNWHWVSARADDTLAHSGKYSASWPASGAEARNFHIGHDWTEYDQLEFWCYSHKDTGARIMLRLPSENPETDGWDYYWTVVPIDWQGWKQFRIPLHGLAANREPVGFSKIDALCFAAEGWEDLLRQAPGTRLNFDDFVLTKAQPGNDLVLSDMELDLYNWHFLEPEREEVKQGKQAGAWRDTVTHPNLYYKSIPHDWSGFDDLCFWVHAEKANGAKIMVLARSENNATPRQQEPDYYSHTFVVDWTGWKHFRVPLRKMLATRQPKGWKQIDMLHFSANWSWQPKTDTVLRLDDIRLVHRTIELKEKGRERVKRTEGSGEFSWSAEIANPTDTTHVLSTTLDKDRLHEVAAELCSPPSVKVAAGRAEPISVRVTVPSALLDDVSAIARESFRVVVTPDGAQRPTQSLTVNAAQFFFASRHSSTEPSLFLPARTVEELRLKLRDPEARAIWEDLAKEQRLTEPLPEIRANAQYALARLDSECLALRLTGERTHLDKCRALIGAIASWPHWVDEESQATDRLVDLSSSHVAGALARAYDALRNELTEPERQAARLALVEHSLEPLAGALAQGVWYVTQYDFNQTCVILGQNGLAALALLEKEPRAAALLAEIVPHVQRILDAIGEGGGWQEGFTYRDYGLVNLAQFMDALRRVTEGRADFFKHPHWRSMGTFSLYGSLAPDAYVNFSDSDYTPYDRALLFKLAAETRDPHVQWLALRQRPNKSDVFQYVWYDPSVPATPPDNLPSVKHFQGVDWVVMRDGWGDDATVFALRSGYRGPHGQLDANSFLLQAYGERFIVDLGRGPYHKDYFDRTKRWDDYHNATLGHNTILIDGQNQTPGDDGGRLVRAEDRGEYGYALADATTTYAGAQKVLRHVVFLKPRTFVVLDEIVTAAAADIQSLLHPATLRTEVEGNVIRIRGKDQSSLLVHMLLPESVVVRRDRHEGREPFLRLSAPASSAHAQFLTVLYPLRDADPQPKIGLATQGDDLVVHVEAGARRWEVTFAGLARAEATEAGTGVTDVSVLVRNAP